MPELARIGFCVGDEVADIADRQVVVDDQHQRDARDTRDRRDALGEIERQGRIERGVDGVGSRGQQQRVAVRRRDDHGLRADIAAGARLVLDHEGLAEFFAEALADQPRQHVGRATRRVRHHPFHRARGVGEFRLCRRETACAKQG
jgi:hypothetical protein